MSRKVIIDVDPGIGGAIAIATALADPDIDLIGITATSGRVSGVDATRNIQAIVEQLDPQKWPRLGSSDRGLPEFDSSLDVDLVTFSALNGSRGLGDYEPNVAELHRPQESTKLMVDLVRNHPHEVTLLTFGPLTNVELASELAPDFLDLLQEIVCLGGSIHANGNITATAEFNIFANPEAARNVLRSPATKTLIPLETSRMAVLTFDQYDRVENGSSAPICQLFRDLLPFAFRAHHQHLGEEGIRLHEVVGLATIAHLRLFERDAMAIDIETRGNLTRGMTVFDRRGIENWQTNIDVLIDVDAQGVLDYFMRTIGRGNS